MRNIKLQRKTVLGWIAIWSWIGVSSAMAINGKLSVTVKEAGKDGLLPCRAWVEAPSLGERYFLPRTKTCYVYDRDRSFSCNGQFLIEVPANKVVVHIERGKEYIPVDYKTVVHENKTTELTIELKRWINMVEEGWYSADVHCHYGLKKPEAMKQVALADDVNMQPFLSVWMHRAPNAGAVRAWPKKNFNFYAGPNHLITLRNEEIERIGGGKPFLSVGALLMLGLNAPVRIDGNITNYPCDVTLMKEAKASSPDCVIDCDKPNWGENVVGMAFGLFDSAQLCHNHYARTISMPIGWGMADSSLAKEDQKEDLKPGEIDEEELFRLTNKIYYRWLNCGFKLAVTGGSAMRVMRVPLGYSRTYAKLDGPLTEANYLKALKAGRTFATSGPMLILTADGKDMGSTIQYSSNENKPIKVKAHLRSIENLESLELIHNGRVVKTIDLKDRKPSPVLEKTLSMELKPDRSGWVAARALFRAVDRIPRQAHTSPVYIVVDGKPTAFKRDAEYMIKWINRILEVSNLPDRYSSDMERGDVQHIFKQARKVYEKIAQTAGEVWGD